MIVATATDATDPSFVPLQGPPFLVGELNPYGSDPYYALWPEPERASGHRLQSLILGIDEGHYVALRRANLCTSRWSAPAARKRATELLDDHPYPGGFVLLGAKVASAFGAGFAPFARFGRTLILPHPSGLCRLWNGPESFRRARSAVRAAFPEWANLVRLETK